MREIRPRLDDTGVRVLDVEILRLTAGADRRFPAGARNRRASRRRWNVLVAGNDPDESRLVDNFAALSDIALAFRIAPNLEPMPWTDVKELRRRRACTGVPIARTPGC